MTDGGYALLVHRRLPGPSEAEHAELAQLRERFRSHHIFCDAPRGRGVRYLACRAVSGVRPHTIITDDLAELRYELEQAAPGELALSIPWRGCPAGPRRPAQTAEKSVTTARSRRVTWRHQHSESGTPSLR